MSEETISSSTGMGSSDATAAKPGRGGLSRGILIGGLVAVIAVVGVVLIAGKSGGSRSGTAVECSGSGINCAVGDTGPGGGTVFYVAATPFTCGATGASTCNYLEAAPHGWQSTFQTATTVDQKSKWNSCNATQTTGNGIGAGAANTAKINSACSADTTAAGFQAANYRGNTRTDWYLPAKDEFTQMNSSSNRTLLGLDANLNYWSSSVGTSKCVQGTCPTPGSEAYSQTVASTAWSISVVSQTFGVRPIRAF
ncbi:MAG: hypothetical protein WCJ48_01475 [Actinomycetes bacterium]